MSGVRSPVTILAALACVVAWAGAGCGDDAGRATAPARTTTAPGPAAAPDDPAPPAPPEGRAVRFSATDGVRLRGILVPGRDSPAPGVVLVHEANAGPEQWEPFVAYLHAAGYAALTYRSRERQQLDETANARDVAGAVRAMREQEGVDRRRIGLVGASIGATAVSYLGFLPAGRAVDAGVGLSPATFLDEPPAGRAPRDLLLIADSSERGAAELIAERAPAIEVRTAPVLGHGVALLDDRRVRDQVLDWLAERLRPR
jgi:alpha-beta hydrolase superfamily lysophospholipase